METIIGNQTKLNVMQWHLLQMFNFTKTEKDLEELKKILLEYYQKKVDEESDRIWIEKNLSNQKLDELLNTHLRTAYK